jgi:hypothetical protein
VQNALVRVPGRAIRITPTQIGAEAVARGAALAAADTALVDAIELQATI